jgi:hypothetical protein
MFAECECELTTERLHLVPCLDKMRLFLVDY